MLAEKKTLSLNEIEAQTAHELPSRDLMLVTVVITNVLNNNVVEITVEDVNVGLQICAALLATGRFECELDVD